MATAQKKSDSTEAQTRQFNAETSKVLKLVIHSLYTNRDIFLRELVSNASDACEKLRYLSLTKPEVLKEDSELVITLSSDSDAKTLTVADNGVGMNEEDLVNNLGTIAKSGTEEFLSQLTGDTKKDASLIGQFGVGFYSVFMVADQVRVETRKADEKVGYIWESTGDGAYTIEEADYDVPRGTRITLTMKKGEEEYLDRFRMGHIVSTYSDHISFPIRYQGKEEGEALETLNEGSALWSRAKSSITKEQYEEFYHHVGHSSDEPWLTLHNQVEGKLSYTNLLFVPSVRPFDLFHPERRRRVKLYVKRVFITDENVDLVPHYLRFLRGVIDSEDLPLNISRETLQNNPQLTAIRDSITKKVLVELKKKGKKDKAEYAKFWANFGAVLKEGLCEMSAAREALLEACVFNTTHDKELSSLEEYVERMDENQEFIYYITGDRLDTLRNHPQIEGFLKKNIEVVLLHDHVDDFWVTVTPEFKGKKLKSVLSAGEELSKIGKEKDASKKEDDAEEVKTDSKDIENLIAAFKTIFGEEVQDVRTTSKLTESPVCLAIEDGAMSMRMERFLVEHKQMMETSARILEINPEHPVIAGLAKRVSDNGVKPEVEDMAHILLDQARIVEGEELADPSAFTRRINSLLGKGLL